MAFDYDKNKNSHGNDSFWTSYSDLFLGLSAIFLLLYVTASLRTGTDALKGQIENQKLAMKVEELENQLKMYESVKTDYMRKEADKSEVQEYQELMDKLTLLEEEAKDEKTRLAQAALENEGKAKALNKYQQMVRNVLNANKVAKSRIISRGEVIGEQIEEIGQQKQEIASLEQDVALKKRRLEENERRILASEETLRRNMQDLQKAYRANKMTKKAYDQRMKKLKDESSQRISVLQEANQRFEGQIQAGNEKIGRLGRELASTQSTLDSTRSDLAETQGQLQQSEAAARGLKDALDQSARDVAGLRGQIGALQAGHAAEKARDRAAFDGEMKRLKLGAAERAAREGRFRAEAARKEKDLQGKLAGLQGQLRDTEGALAKAKEEMDARREVAREIQQGFARAGVKADVDMQTGEVILDFGDAYFESDSANIKPEMRRVLEKAMPVYSRSLFGNPKVAGKISAVEIVGFASPTYQGRFIDPTSSRPEDKTALKYNMDLSYRRANAIFGHLLDEKNPDFRHQKELLSLMKVSGRSFLEVMNVKNRNVATAAEFCKQNDCRKAQRVIVRFSMDGK